MVYVISTKEYSDAEIEEMREDIITRPAFMEGRYDDEKYNKSTTYKIVLI